MLASKRQISEITLSEEAGAFTEKLDLIFNKFGTNVKKFNVSGCKIQEKQLCRWINMMSVLEEINFEKISFENQADGSISMLYLPMLRKLKLKNIQFDDSSNFIKVIPTGIIEELSWNNCLQRNKGSFSRSYLNAKKIKMSSDIVADQSILYESDSEELPIDNTLYTVFSRQQNLTVLNVKQVSLDDDLFNVICSMSQLEHLNFSLIMPLSSSALANIEHLTNLKGLLINDGDKYDLESITNLNMPNLEFLGLLMFPGLDECWDKMEGRFGGLKKVQCGPCYSLQTIGALFAEFPKLEFMKMAMADGPLINQYEPDRLFDFSNLKKFIIWGSQILPTYMDVLPLINICKNLEEITLYTPQDISVLNLLLDTKTRLRKLAIFLDRRSSENPKLGSEIVECLEGNALQLRILSLKFELEESIHNIPFDVALIKLRLNDRFPIIVKSLFNGSFTLLIKKRGAEEEFWF